MTVCNFLEDVVSVVVLCLPAGFVSTRVGLTPSVLFTLNIDNQRNGLETQVKALTTSVIRPDTLYFGTL